jgi:hypothetical protein
LTHAGRMSMGRDSLEWMELEQLSAHIGDLHRRYGVERAMKRVNATKAIEREIVETMAQRQRLLGRLSDRLANQIVASSATPAEASL